MTSARGRLSGWLVIPLLLLSACRQQQPTSADIELKLSASALRVGEATLTLSVFDAAGNAIGSPGALSLRGDMDHAGMAPVLVTVDKAADGVFNAPFEWTMAGDWIVEASLQLESGAIARETFHFTIVSAKDDADMAGMRQGDGMEQGAMSGGSSAVYMQIMNQGESDITLRSASSAAADIVELHRTIIKDDVARMEALDGLRIPAGDTVDLAPGGAHIKLNMLSVDLPPGSQFMLQLMDDAGAVYDLNVAVLDMPPSDLDDAIKIGDLAFSNRWARPANAAAAMETAADEG